MSNSNKYNHIYVEKDVINHQLTSDILNKFPKANIILIEYYWALAQLSDFQSIKPKGDNKLN